MNGIHSTENDMTFFLERRVEELEAAIRQHRDQKGDDRCWFDDQELYAVLKDGNLGDNTVGDKEAMLKNCQRYVTHRCEGGGDWKTYEQLEQENKYLNTALISYTHFCNNAYKDLADVVEKVSILEKQLNERLHDKEPG
jgi:hypothetical protein